MRELSLKNLSHIFVSICVGSAAVFIVIALAQYSLATRADRYLLAYQEQADSNVIELTVVVDRMGYGGMIHNYKKYLLRGGADRLRTFDQSAGAIQSSLSKLDAQLGPAFHDDVGIIKATVDAYVTQMETIRQIRLLDSNAEGIDAVVRIDDRPALAALSRLRSHIISTEVETKATLLFKMRYVLGYGGMIHDFKNYVLRKDERLAARVGVAGAQALLALERYRSLGVTSEESAALDAIAQTLNTYLRNVSTITEMARAGAMAADIDPLVKVPDGPALSAFEVLDRAAQIEILSAQTSMHRAMGILKTGSILMAIIVIAGCLAFAKGFHWAIQRAGVVPAAAIADGLERMANGDTHVDLSAWAGESEIGKIAGASRAFQKALVENVRIAQDLRGRVSDFERLSEEMAVLERERKQLREEQSQLTDTRIRYRSERLSMQRGLEDVITATESGDFSQRVPIDFQDTGLAQLGENINRMLNANAKALADVVRLLANPNSANLADLDEGSMADAARMLHHSMTETLQSLSQSLHNVRPRT